MIRSLIFSGILMATWRNGRPPVRLSDPVHVVLPKTNVVLSPFEGQPKKYSRPRRLPGLAVKVSGVRKAGNGVFLAERVRKGQTITLFRRKIISEAAAKKLKKKVYNNDLIRKPLNFEVDFVDCREIGTFASIVQLACA